MKINLITLLISTMMACSGTSDGAQASDRARNASLNDYVSNNIDIDQPTEVETSGAMHGRIRAADGSSLNSGYSAGFNDFKHAHGDDWYPTLTPPADWTSTAIADPALYQHLWLAPGTACDVTVETYS